MTLMFAFSLGVGGCKTPDRSSPSPEAPQTPSPSIESPPSASPLKPAAQWGPYRERSSESLAAAVQKLDSDGDHFVNAVDNCPFAANPTQSDKDKDGYGDACDPGDPVPLRLRLTSPRNGARVAAGACIRLAAAITTPQSRVGGVRFVVTDVAAAASEELATKEERPYEFTWTDAMPGTYRLRAEAWDEYGNERQSQTVTIVVGATELSFDDLAGTWSWADLNMGDWAELTLEVPDQFTLEVQGGELGDLVSARGRATLSGQTLSLTGAPSWFPSAFHAGMWSDLTYGYARLPPSFVLVPEIYHDRWCRDGGPVLARYARFRPSKTRAGKPPSNAPPLCRQEVK